MCLLSIQHNPPSRFTLSPFCKRLHSPTKTPVGISLMPDNYALRARRNGPFAASCDGKPIKPDGPRARSGSRVSQAGGRNRCNPTRASRAPRGAAGCRATAPSDKDQDRGMLQGSHSLISHRQVCIFAQAQRARARVRAGVGGCPIWPVVAPARVCVRACVRAWLWEQTGNGTICRSSNRRMYFECPTSLLGYWNRCEQLRSKW